MIEGETGTGKELVAQALHAADTRCTGPFVALNCAVLNESLLESELFGHERGAFTGAERRKIGRFELANGGTLLLDEVGDIPPGMQAKLLRVLQTGMFERVGGTETIKVKVRILAATHKHMEDEVKNGRFRADLFYRLNVIRIELPPLRERTEDIPLLATHFLEKHRSEKATPVTEIHSDAMQALLRHNWPGNVRELENAIKAGIALADGSVLHRDDLPESVAPRVSQSSPHSLSLLNIERSLPELTDDLVGQIEREYFVRLLSQYKGNVARCARHSGLSRRSVTQKLQKYGLERAQFKTSISQHSGRRFALTWQSRQELGIGGSGSGKTKPPRSQSPNSSLLFFSASRQGDVLELELERNGDHFAGSLVDKLVFRRLTGSIHEQVFEAELAAIVAGVGETAVEFEPGAIRSLEPKAVIE